MSFKEFMRGETLEVREPDVRVGRLSFEDFCQGLWDEAFEEGKKEGKAENET